jgi:choline dehydrogenase-like flavoprotein
LEQPIADVCLVGVGALGGIFAKEIASAGLKVVGFERGPAGRAWARMRKTRWSISRKDAKSAKPDNRFGACSAESHPGQ